MDKPKVSIIKGNNRYQNIIQSINALKDEISQAISGKQKILIKPNFLYANKPIASTNVQAVKATLDFLSQFSNQEIIIAEAPFSGTLEQAVKNYHYSEILKNYNIKYLDLNQEPTKQVELKINNSEKIKLNIARPVLESDFRISVCPAKTHDTVIVTLGIKNLAVGSIIASSAKLGKNCRSEIHGDHFKTNKILFELIKIIPPHLTIIDAWQGMEGDGPVNGTPVDMKLALSSLDPVAADSVMAYLMGFNPSDIGYLYLASQANLGTNDPNAVELIGNADLKLAKKPFKPHSTYKKQLGWKLALKKLDTIL